MAEEEVEEVEYERPPHAKYQLDAFFHQKRYAFIEGTTKCGKTYTGMNWLFEEANQSAFRNHWWVAPVFAQAKIAYTRLKNAIPEPLRKPNDTELTLTLPWADKVLWFKSGEKPDNLYGEDVGSAVLDEASRMREEAFHAVRSTLTATRGRLRAIGNVKGRTNWFFKMCRSAEEALHSATPTEMHYAKITAMDAVAAGILPAEEIEDARRMLPEAVFNELYMAIPNEDGSNPFGYKHISACVAQLSSMKAACYGWDFAKSIDWTVGLGLDYTGATCAFTRFQQPWEQTYESIYDFTKGGAPSLVDSTGIGDPILARLQKDKPGKFEGYKFSSESKQKLMEGLAVAIQTKAISFPDGPIRAELDNFEFEYTRTGVRYSAPEGFHDDCVMALALAWQLFSTKASLRPSSSWGGSPSGAKRNPSWHRPGMP